MSNIVQFIPKKHITSQQNLERFVLLCRDSLTVFGANLDWDSHAWPRVCNFTKKDAPSRGYSEEQLLDPAIMPFAKAYLRYQQGHNPSKLKNELKAIRCIEAALLEVKGCADITMADISVLDEAGRVALSYGKAGATAYQAGISLVKLVDFLNESGIIAAPLAWKNPVKKPKEIHGTDSTAKKKRHDKMPPEGSLEAMAEMFFNDLQSPRDRFTTSIFALCMCAPSRITEVQDLPLNCLVRVTDSKGIERVGLRFYAGKGYGSDIKWIPTPLVQIAEEAVRRLTDMSAPGRALATWLEDHPDEFYRHTDCPSVDEDQALSPTQACMALGLTPGANPLAALTLGMRSYKPFKSFLALNGHVTLRFLNGFLHSKLPKGWPWLNKDRHIKYSDALCCFRQNELRTDFPPRPVIVWSPGKSTFSTDINYIDGQERSIWERHAYKNIDGSPISMTSHQIRHYLNTLANRGDLGQLDIAKCSGRANVHQNSTYNHMTDEEYVERAREAGVGGTLDKIKANKPVTYSDLNAAGVGIAHVTLYGFCIHDFSMLPCQRHRDCLNCTEQVCVKGDVHKLERLKAQRDLIRGQLSKAQSANEDGVYGADRWSQHQIKTLERVDQLIEILDSTDVPDGTVVRLSNDQEFSPLKRALAARSASPKLEGPDKAEPEVDEIRTLLEM